MKAILGRPDKKRQTPCIASQLYMSLAIESKPGQSQHVDLLRTGNALATPSHQKSYHKPSRLVKANPSASFSPLRRKEPVAKLLFCINTGCTESLPCARGGGPKGRRGCVQAADACYDPSVSLEADSIPIPSVASRHLPLTRGVGPLRRGALVRSTIVHVANLRQALLFCLCLVPAGQPLQEVSPENGIALPFAEGLR